MLLLKKNTERGSKLFFVQWGITQVSHCSAEVLRVSVCVLTGQQQQLGNRKRYVFSYRSHLLIPWDVRTSGFLERLEDAGHCLERAPIMANTKLTS